MKLLTVLDQAYKVRPNACHKDILVQQLLQGLEGDVADMIGMDVPEYVYEEPVSGTPEDLDLLMPYPYDDIYLWYLCAQIDLMQEETQLYADDMALFNTAWARAQAYYRRNTPSDDLRNWKVM